LKKSTLLGLGLIFSIVKNVHSIKPPDVVPQDTIATDRPSFSNSSITVPKHGFQIESGWLRQTAQDSDGTRTTLTQTPVLLRIGFSDHVEARLGTDGYTWQKTNHEETQGMGDESLGIKWHQRDQAGEIPAIGSLVTVVFPSGNSEIRGRGARPSYTLPLDWTLSPVLSLTLMPGIIYNTIDSGQHYVAPLTSIVANYSWTPKFQTFAEWAGQQFAAPQWGGSILTADTGVTYLLTKAIQVDGALGWGLNHFSPTFYSTAGLSFRY
jgi:hypothetical protein